MQCLSWERSLCIDLVCSCDRPPLVVAMLVAMLYFLEHVERGATEAASLSQCTQTRDDRTAGKRSGC